MPADVDPKLREQLDDAGDGGSVKAVIALATTPQAGGAASSAAQDLLHRVSQEVGEQPQEVTPLAHLGVVIVRGSGRYLRQLLDQEQVVSATAVAPP
jgi:hypothetical protein